MIPGIRSALTRHIEQNKLTTTDIANAIGISRAHVSRILNGGNASTKVWRKLLTHCNLTIEVAPMPGASGRLFDEDTHPNGPQIHHDLTRLHSFIDATIPDLDEDAPTPTLQELERRIQALENERRQAGDRLQLAKETSRLSEPEPWHSAKLREVWDLMLETGPWIRAIVKVAPSGRLCFYDLADSLDAPLALDSRVIVHAQKQLDVPEVQP